MPVKLDTKHLPAIIPPSPSSLQIMKDGFSFGIGSAVAQRVVGSMLTTSISKETEYDKCMETYKDKDMDICEKFKHTQ